MRHDRQTLAHDREDVDRTLVDVLFLHHRAKALDDPRRAIVLAPDVAQNVPQFLRRGAVRCDQLVGRVGVEPDRAEGLAQLVPD